jgi:hypothetical protein
VLRWILILAIGWWLARLVRRTLRLRSARSDGRQRRAADGQNDDRLDRLTRQEIADADFEEIPEEE